MFTWSSYCFEKHNYVVRQANLFSLLVCFCCLKLKRSHRLEKENTHLTLRHRPQKVLRKTFSWKKHLDIGQALC